jgi:sulfatase maturation enzyme AslB (radical SAM superfamily)
MLLSNGTINFTSDDIVCLFNKYTLKKYYLKKSEFDNPSTELIRELEKLKLVNASIDLSEYVKRMSGVRFSVAYLFLTDNCNLNCKYCFIESCF